MKRRMLIHCSALLLLLGMSPLVQGAKPTGGNRAPTANFTFSPTSPVTGQIVTFTNSSTDPDGNPLTYTWDFGDSSITETTVNVTHTFAPGIFSVKLTARDSGGLTSTKTQAITAMPSVAYLKKSCVTGDISCFTTFDSLLTWMWGTRNPSASFPLLVNVDPGIYNLSNTQPFCPDGRGYVTLRGSGQETTVLTAGAYGSTGAVLSFINCAQISVQDLTVLSGGRPGGVGASDTGISWERGGSSTWTNVWVRAAKSAWIDGAGSGTCTPGKHQWAASKLETEYGNFQRVYYSTCGDTRFYGGEMTARSSGGMAGGLGLVGVQADGANAAVRIAGAAIRVLAMANAGTAIPGQFGLIAANSGQVEMTGGIVSVRSESTFNQSVTGASAQSSGLISTPGTAFGLLASGTGTATRLSASDPSAVKAPFVWAADIDPPQSKPGGSDIVSTNGQDIFVETTCASIGCTTNGSEPHLLIYNNNCSNAGPWFDVVTKKCRGAP